jgi:hypothetical protein
MLSRARDPGSMRIGCRDILRAAGPDLVAHCGGPEHPGGSWHRATFGKSEWPTLPFTRVCREGHRAYLDRHRAAIDSLQAGHHLQETTRAAAIRCGVHRLQEISCCRARAHAVAGCGHAEGLIRIGRCQCQLPVMPGECRRPNSFRQVSRRWPAPRRPFALSLVPIARWRSAASTMADPASLMADLCPEQGVRPQRLGQRPQRRGFPRPGGWIPAELPEFQHNAGQFQQNHLEARQNASEPEERRRYLHCRHTVSAGSMHELGQSWAKRCSRTHSGRHG